MKSTFRTRFGRDRIKTRKKNSNFRSRSKYATVLSALLSDIETGFLRMNGHRTDIPLNEQQLKRINAEIAVLKTKV